MSPAERKRRAKLRKQAKARKARQLFREFVKNKKREWDAMVEVAKRDRDWAVTRQHRAERMLSDFVSVILAINPDFPVPGREPNYAPSYLCHSGFMEQVPARKHWAALADPSRRDWSTMSETHLRTWFTFISGDLDNDMVRQAKVFRVRATNRENGHCSGTDFALSNAAMCSRVPLDYLLRDMAEDFVQYMQGDK